MKKENFKISLVVCPACGKTTYRKVIAIDKVSIRYTDACSNDECGKIYALNISLEVDTGQSAYDCVY